MSRIAMSGFDPSRCTSRPIVPVTVTGTAAEGPDGSTVPTIVAAPAVDPPTAPVTVTTPVGSEVKIFAPVVLSDQCQPAGSATDTCVPDKGLLPLSVTVKVRCCAGLHAPTKCGPLPGVITTPPVDAACAGVATAAASTGTDHAAPLMTVRRFTPCAPDSGDFSV